MRFEYRVEKKVKKVKKERERERRQVVTSFKINARLSGWKAGILFYRAKPEIPVSLYKSRGEKSGFVSNPVVTIRCATIRW